MSLLIAKKNKLHFQKPAGVLSNNRAQEHPYIELHPTDFFNPTMPKKGAVFSSHTISPTRQHDKYNLPLLLRVYRQNYIFHKFKNKL